MKKTMMQPALSATIVSGFYSSRRPPLSLGVKRFSPGNVQTAYSSITRRRKVKDEIRLFTGYPKRFEKFFYKEEQQENEI